MRWRRLLPRRDLDERDIRDELRTHVALRIEDNLARGLTPDEARAEAERRFGSMHSVARESARIRRRQSALSRTLAVDGLHALRAARRAPLTTLVGAAVMAIGLGTVAAAWLVADLLLHTPPPGVNRPHELYSALEARQSRDGSHLSFLRYRQLAPLANAVPDASLFAWGQREVQLVAGATARPVGASMVTGNYFETLRLVAAEGRLLTDADARQRHLVCVVSLRLARALGEDAAVHRRITVNGQRFEIVGVAPARFHGLEAGDPVDLWMPLETEPAVSTVSILPDGSRLRGYVEANVGWLRGGVRIRERASIAEAAQKLSAAAKEATANPQVRQTVSIALTDRPWMSPWPSHRERLNAVLTPVSVAAALTLVLTSACLGSLFAARISDQRREYAVRLALGAGSGRIVRCAAFEMTAVSALGGAGAWLVTHAVLRAAGDLVIANDVTVADAVASVPPRALLDFVILAFVTMALASAAPLLYAGRLCRAVRIQSPRSAPGTTFRSVLVAAQIAAACALLAGAGMMTQSLFALRAQPLGFDAGGTAFVELNPSGAGLADEERRSLVDRILATQAGMGLSDEAPFGAMTTIFARAEAARDPRQYPLPVSRIAGPYFEILRVPLLAGRAFEPRDRGQPVVIISAPLAESWWPKGTAIGRVVRIGLGAGTPHEVIGVVNGLRDLSLRAEATARLYLPLGEDFGRLVLVVRASPRHAAGLVDQARALDSRLVALRSGSVDRLVARTLEQRRALQMLSGTIGLGALLMVTVGVWGLSHGNVRHRWQEFGIRLALGAAPRHVGRLASRDAWIIATLGSGSGVLLAWQFGKILQQWLFGVSPYEPWLLTVAAVVVSAAALAGAIGPVRQAMRTDPASLLRER